MYVSAYLHYKTMTYKKLTLAAMIHLAQDSGTPTQGECP